MFEGPYQDRLVIRELIDSYSDAVMRRDVNGLRATWAVDGVWKFRDSIIEGRDAIADRWDAAMDSFSAVFFTAFPGHVMVEGDHAESVTHTFEHLEPVHGAPRFQAGLYRDRLVRTTSGWLFAERAFTQRELNI